MAIVKWIGVFLIVVGICLVAVAPSILKNDQDAYIQRVMGGSGGTGAPFEGVLRGELNSNYNEAVSMMRMIGVVLTLGGIGAVVASSRRNTQASNTTKSPR